MFREPKTRHAALALFILTFAIYIFPLAYDLIHKPFFTWASGQDIASTSVLPVAILERGDFFLDEYRDFFTKNWHSPYFVAEVNGHLVSRYPVAPAVLAMPFYGIPLGTGWLFHPGYDWLTFPWSAFFPGKFAAAFITALAVVMFFFCVRELADLGTSAAITFVFALGTSVWSTASQGLWQQTPSLLFQLIGVWFLLRGRRKDPAAVAPAAFFFSAATIARANNGLTALLFTLYVLIEYRSAFWRWVVWAMPPALLALAYNAIYNGSPFVFGYQEGFAQIMSAPRLDGLIGMFISPSRGLLIYSPFFILALYGVWLARREKEWLFYLFGGIAFVISALFLSMFQGWDGGWGYGTRLLVDVMHYAAFLLVPTFVRLRGAARLAFWATAAYAILLQSFGLWDYGVRWHWHWDNWNYNIWDIAENEPLFYLRQYVEMGSHYLGRFLLR